MKSAWVCASCRRRLFESRLHKASSRPSLRRHKSFHVSYRPPREGPRVTSPPSSFTYENTVERDFFSRVIEGRDLSSGPYSRPYAPPSVPETPASSPLLHRRDVEERKPIFAKPDEAPGPRLRPMKSQLGFAVSREAQAVYNSPHDGHLQNESLPEYAPSNDEVRARPPKQGNGTWPQVLGRRPTVEEAIDAWNRLYQSPRILPGNYERRDYNINLVKTLASAWCDDPTGHAVPPPSATCDIGVKLRSKIVSLIMWKEAFFIVLSRLSVCSSEEAATAMLAQVQEMWNLLMNNHGECNVYDDDGSIKQLYKTNDWPSYISSEQTKHIRRWSDKSLAWRLFNFLSPAVGELVVNAGLDIDMIVLLSLAFLRRSRDTAKSGAQTGSNSGLTEFLGILVTNSNVESRLERYSQRLHSLRTDEHMLKPIMRLIQSAGENVLITQHAPLHSAAAAAGRTEPGQLIETKESVIDMFKKRLSRALAARHVERAERIWTEIQRTFVDDQHPESRSSIPTTLYSLLITTFMGIRAPEKAVQVWNHMTDVGIEPKRDHWDAMIKGCEIARDSHAAEQIWSSLLASGVLPDARLWATRLHCLSACGQHVTAVAKFETMTKEWKADRLDKPRSRRWRAPAVQDQPRAPKPDTHCVNAVVMGLAKAGRYTDLVRIFSVAAELDITLNVYTFNPLMRSALQDGDVELALRFLDRMKSLGIQPDVATFTLLIGSALQDEVSADVAYAVASSDSITARRPDMDWEEGIIPSPPPTVMGAIEHHAGGQENEATIKRLFELMTAARLKPTPHTYSTLVAGLVRAEPPNIRAAYGVLHYLTRNGLPRSAQIYTTLLRFHFEQQPPDLTSVEALWHHARAQRSTEGATLLDGIFYDRLVGGWVQVGSMDRALEVLRAAWASSQTVAWGTLTMLIEGLLEDGNMEDAFSLARQAIEVGGSEIFGGREAKAKFIEQWQRQRVL